MNIETGARVPNNTVSVSKTGNNRHNGKPLLLFYYAPILNERHLCF